MIEGNDDVDEIWLWVDGDEEWVRQNRHTSGWDGWPQLEKEDWVAAQSALRRRIERTQLTPRPIPKKTAGLTLEDHARLREATPAQRFAALYWLICTSRRKEELDLQHGTSSRSNFALRDRIHLWFSPFGSLASFPEQVEAWNEFLEKRKAMGCHCPHSEEKTRDWARMMKWLRPEWNLDVDIGCLVEYHGCNACESRAEEIYDRLYGHSRDIPLLPIQLAFSLDFVGTFNGFMVPDVDGAPIHFVKAVASKSLSPNAQREADQRFWPLCTPGERDTTYSPWVNAYPDVMRESLAYFSGEVGPYSRLHSLPPVQAFRDEYLDELPVGFADDAPNLITLVGTVIWISACRFLNGAEAWHWGWDGFIAFKHILPLPELAGPQLELRNHFEMLRSEDSSCFGHGGYPHEDDEDYLWTIYTVIVMHVKSLNLGPKFEGCPKCHAAYLTVVTGSGSGAETSLLKAAMSVNCRTQLHRPLHVILFHHLSTAEVFHPLKWMTQMGFTFPPPSSMWRYPSTTGSTGSTHAYENWWIARAAAADLYFPSDILHMVARPDTQPAIPTSSTSNIVELDTIEEQQTPANSTHPGDVTTLRFNATPNGDLKKRHKIAKIKEILIDMLREIDFPLHNRYLPWSTLEGDLRKHGFEITNWPSGVPRENDKGISTLSAGHVHKLYLALTQARVEDRPRFIRRVDQSTESEPGYDNRPQRAWPEEKARHRSQWREGEEDEV
ncbi:hypothetical protein PAXINDRAFT_20648 [Paxillus involutus ATCC 200175]|uniref:Uncharacterized protein n=1 Tax=Paxillus involutus ATCC 200175 TaxID=664439 RepID=A0A0C9TD93_PAXIN|nr:hypothetical protein PAXINDRAFT_20648 [Paxillus involutus ATCC 200175]